MFSGLNRKLHATRPWLKRTAAGARILIRKALGGELGCEFAMSDWQDRAFSSANQVVCDPSIQTVFLPISPSADVALVSAILTGLVTTAIFAMWTARPVVRWPWLAFEAAPILLPAMTCAFWICAAKIGATPCCGRRGGL